MKRTKRVAWGLAALYALLAALPAASERAVLRVGTSGDYPPFSRYDDGYFGFDIDVARAYAEERGLVLEFVRFRWPRLEKDLAAGRFDVAMSGVTVRPRRSALGRFTVPVVESGAVALVGEHAGHSSIEALDHRSVRIGVNAGGHLERVARDRFQRATLVIIGDNAAVRRALLDGSVDAVLSDTLEAPLWRRDAGGIAMLGPLTRDRKAYLVRAERGDLARDLDSWLLAREADGSLAKLREKHLGRGAVATATPLASLFAAMDERVALMPLVGAAKRRDGLPLEVPAREALVFDAAALAATAAANRLHTAPPPVERVHEVFRALIEAAKLAQFRANRDPDFIPPQPLPSLDAELRPALLRLGERIAGLLVGLPPDLDPAAVKEAGRDGLRAKWLDPEAGTRIADAVARLAAAPR